MIKVYYCIEPDCNNTVCKNGNRCKSCAKKGNRNSNYISEKILIIYYCMEENCDKKVSSPNRRCRSCSKKGKLHPRFNKNAKTKKQYHCIEFNCNKKISYGTFFRGGKRCRSCAMKYLMKNPKNNPNYGNGDKIKGTKNPMYGKHQTKESRKKISLTKGGTGIPYENNNYPPEFFRIRNKILKRDNYICQLCFEYGNEVHHIDYDKNNNKEENLICSCHRCNMKVNFNRSYWKNHFEALVTMN